MKKSPHLHESWPNMNEFWAFAAANRGQAETALTTQADLLRQVQDLQKAWIEIAQEVAKSSADVLSRCAKCGNPGEAARLYSDWISQQMDSLFADSRRLGEQWLQLYDTALAPLKAMQGGETAGKHTDETARETNKGKDTAAGRTRTAGA
jgi:hypothetical protein